jgi:hypothetical protein
MNPQNQSDYDQPVAYDNEGRPLYAHPPTDAQAAPQQSVHITRPVDPVSLAMSPEAIKRHDDSAAAHPLLNLSKQEYIISEVQRHPIGLLAPLAIGSLLALGVLTALFSYPLLVPNGNPTFASLLLPAILLLALIGLAVYIVVWVYQNNKFYLTNESVIQETQTTLFSHNEQTVSLSNIEDASYTQTGIFQMMLNYGSIRLSTEGDETTYRFNYVSDPKHEIALLNNAVEAFKNGRPVVND